MDFYNGDYVWSRGDVFLLQKNEFSEGEHSKYFYLSGKSVVYVSDQGLRSEEQKYPAFKLLKRNVRYFKKDLELDRKMGIEKEFVHPNFYYYL